MKILYISPQNTVGTLNLWQWVHRSRGHECRYVTYFPSPVGYPEDICLHLPLVEGKGWFTRWRDRLYRRSRGPLGDETLLPGDPPIWQPGSLAEQVFFTGRDRLWRLWVEPAIRRHELLDFDVYHLEWGLEFYRNGDFVRRLEQLGKPMLATYHGQDFRNRGVVPAVDSRVRLSMTSEYDIIPRHPNLHYLFLPYDVEAFEAKTELHDPITICHATRNRYVKGSEAIIAAGQALERSHGIRFLLIENRPHAETLARKAEADIYIDQVADLAPGYGMNSIEAMALGLACCTSMDAAYSEFMPEHPFLNVKAGNLHSELQTLVENPDRILELGRAARRWAEKHHALKPAGEQLYRYYRQVGIEA